MIDQAPGLEDGELLAAIDIGSNSFHMVVARIVLGQLRIIDRLREPVRIGSGLRANGSLDPAARHRALVCLSRFGERIRSLPPGNVRAIATNTVRQLRHPQRFLVPAETALGHGIEVVSGHEEARLIYLGVAHGLPPGAARRLVIDIGGGSTEFIIGSGFQPLRRESLQMGCVASTRRFFPDGRLSRERWRAAQLELELQLRQFGSDFAALGWEETIGSSGTARAIAEMQARLDGQQGVDEITRAGVQRLVELLLDSGHIDAIRIAGVSEERRPVIAGGLLILDTCFRALGLERMQTCETAMREGVLRDILGRARETDPRHEAIVALGIRYDVDPLHAERVARMALQCFDQVAGAWDLGRDERLMLGWAAQVHEVGLAISHSQYQRHGAYILANSDIDGFSRQEQAVLAALVRCQRRRIHQASLQALPARMQRAALYNSVLLRLAILLHRSHDLEAIPEPGLQARDNALRVELPAGWLACHTLSRADLVAEQAELERVGISLEVVERPGDPA